MGLAARFTLGIGIGAVLVALPTTWLLLRTAESLQREASEAARRDLALTTGAMRSAGAKLPPDLRGHTYPEEGGQILQVAVDRIETAGGSEVARIYRVMESPGGEGAGEGPGEPAVLFASAEDDPAATSRLVVLVLMVTGGMVLAVVVLGAWIARRAVAPVQSMIEDVLAVSRGHLDHAIRPRAAVGEVAALARALDRTVQEIRAREEAERTVARSQREAELLRELRRNLRPMKVEAPGGYAVETCVLEAEGAGSGDFVDAIGDLEGRLTLVVGATAARGTPGALLMAMTRAYLRDAILQGQSPAHACAATNTALNRDLVRGLYASGVVARLEPLAGRVELVSAGHKAPAVRWEAAGGQLRKLQPNGIALGFDEGPVFRKSLETASVELQPGDALLLFSPGVFECAGAQGRALGESGAYALARLAALDGLESMERKLRAFLGGPPRGDLAFALLRRLPGPRRGQAAS